jgi:hypothetical protein
LEIWILDKTFAAFLYVIRHLERERQANTDRDKYIGSEREGNLQTDRNENREMITREIITCP